MYYRKATFILIISFLLSSCAFFHEDMTSVDDFVNKEDYASAISELDNMNSSFAKKKSSEVHVQYAISILKNIKEDKRTRYFAAKDVLEKAVQLNPKNKEAQTYYLMVLKLSKNA